MMEEEINRKFELVANHMASFAVSLDQLGEKVNALAEAQRRTDERLERTEGNISALLTIAEIQSEEIRLLTDSVRAVDQRQRRSDEQQQQIDERLNALINIVEKDISERRNRKNGE